MKTKTTLKIIFTIATIALICVLPECWPTQGDPSFWHYALLVVTMVCILVVAAFGAPAVLNAAPLFDELFKKRTITEITLKSRPTDKENN